MNAIPGSKSPILAARRKLGDSPLARWVLSQAVCFKAPYFRSIRPTFLTLEPGEVEVWLPKRRAVTNHLGTVHAIAMCNAAELAGGTCVEVTLPATMRWIPVRMEVHYQKMAKTSLRAKATVAVENLLVPGDAAVDVTLTDTHGVQVMAATIYMRLSARKK